MREKAAHLDFSAFVSEELEEKIKELAEISMGTEISDEDIENIVFLCDQVRYILVFVFNVSSERRKLNLVKVS